MHGLPKGIFPVKICATTMHYIDKYALIYEIEEKYRIDEMTEIASNIFNIPVRIQFSYVNDTITFFSFRLNLTYPRRVSSEIIKIARKSKYLDIRFSV